MSIQSLRDSSEGIVSKILIGLIIVVFALFGFGSITTFLTPVPKVATVNGEAVTQQDMEIAVERNRRLLLARNQSPDEDALRSQVLQNLISREVLLQAADDLGLHAGEAMLDEQIVSTDVFQIDGAFDAEQFQLVIGSAGYTPMTYREEMRHDLRLQQMVSGIQASSFLLGDEARRISSLGEQTRDVAFLRFDIDELAGEVTPTEAEIQRHYDSNPDQFMTEETVNLEYIEIDRSDLMEEVVVSETELLEYYEETKGRYARDESRRVAHILIEVNDEVTAETALERITEIRQRIVDGESFEAVASEVSDDGGSASEGGDLGFNARGTFVDAFEEVAFELSPNQMSEPVLTEFGYHIIKLLDLEEAHTPEFAEIRAQVEEGYREAEAESVFVDLSARLSEISFEASDLAEPAAALDLEIKETGAVSRSTGEGIAADPQVMGAAFGPDVLLDGNNSRLIEITPNHHVVIRLVDYRPEEIRPLADVREEVISELKRTGAIQMASIRAQLAVDMLESGSITRFVADEFGLVWEVAGDVSRGGPQLDPEINREAFGLPRPPEDLKSVGWAQLSDGDAVVITVTRVNDVPQTDVSEEDVQRLARAFASQQGGYEYSEFNAALRTRADVERVN